VISRPRPAPRFRQELQSPVPCVRFTMRVGIFHLSCGAGLPA
jgi:hypothetical protein